MNVHEELLNRKVRYHDETSLKSSSYGVIVATVYDREEGLLVWIAPSNKPNSAVICRPLEDCICTWIN